MSTTSARTTLTVSDLGRATRFYQNVLGFRVTRTSGDTVTLAAPHLSRELVLKGADRPPMPPAYQLQTALRLRLPSRAALAETCEKLTQSGARVMIVERAQRLSAHTSDPDGHKLELYAQGQPTAASTARPRVLSLDDLKTPA